jgi:hypothetical protein
MSAATSHDESATATRTAAADVCCLATASAR